MDTDSVFRRIATFEDATATTHQSWLGGFKGLALGVALLIGVAALTWLVAALVWLLESRGVFYLLGPVWLMAATATGAYWRRQRLASHFEAASLALASSDHRQRQHGLSQLLLNARRGHAEHRRVAGALSAFLRRPPHDHAEEPGQRQLAFMILTDNTLTLAAKVKLDLSGAVLTNVRGPGADLQGVSLRGADLRGARLARANLRDADLAEALLEGADLAGADVQGTILAQA